MVREICMIENFLFPSLMDERFGHLLEWVDRNKFIFKVYWSHKAKKTWTQRNFAVFIEWDRLKGRIDHCETEYFTVSKGRFRSALNRLCKQGKIEKVKSSLVGYKLYKLINVQDTLRLLHVPETHVEVPDAAPVSPLLESSPVSPLLESSPENSPSSLENLMPFDSNYDLLLDEVSCDAINGHLLSIQELLIPENISPEEDMFHLEGEDITDKFLNSFFEGE